MRTLAGGTEGRAPGGAGTGRGRAGVAPRPGQQEAEWLRTPGGQAAGMGGQ